MSLAFPEYGAPSEETKQLDLLYYAIPTVTALPESLQGVVVNLITM